MLSLPPEIIDYIIDFTDNISKINLKRTCKELRYYLSKYKSLDIEFSFYHRQFNLPKTILYKGHRYNLGYHFYVDSVKKNFENHVDIFQNARNQVTSFIIINDCIYAGSGVNNRMGVWDLKGKFLFHFGPNNYENYNQNILAYKDGLIYCGGNAGGVNIYDLNGDGIFHWDTLKGFVKFLVIGDSGNIYTAIDQFETILIYNNNFELIKEIDFYPYGGISCLKYRQNKVYIGLKSGNINVYSEEIKFLFYFKAQENYVLDIIFYNNVIYSCGTDIRIFNNDGELKTKILISHCITPYNLFLNKDGNLSVDCYDEFS